MDKYAPQKIDIERIKTGLSLKQMTKIQYECDLLRVDMQKMLYLAPHLFFEEEVESVPEPKAELEPELINEPPSQNTEEEHHYYMEEDDYI